MNVYCLFFIIMIIVWPFVLKWQLKRRLAQIRQDVSVRTEEETAKLEQIFKFTETGIFVSGCDNIIERVNPALERMLGYDSGELVGESPGKFFAPIDFETDIRKLQADSGDKKGKKFEAGLLKKDGCYLPVKVYVTVVEDKGGKYYIVNVKDLSKINELKARHLEIECKLYKVQKKKKNASISDRTVHDFNNFLYPIIGYSELLLSEASEGTKQYECLNGIVDSARRAREMINESHDPGSQTDEEHDSPKVKGYIG